MREAGGECAIISSQPGHAMDPCRSKALIAVGWSAASTALGGAGAATVFWSGWTPWALLLMLGAGVGILCTTAVTVVATWEWMQGAQGRILDLQTANDHKRIARLRARLLLRAARAAARQGPRRPGS